MKKCPVCGVPVGTTEEICHVCGINIKRIENDSFLSKSYGLTPAATAAVSGNSVVSEQVAQKKKSHVGAFVAIGVLVLALIVGCAIMLLSSVGGSDLFDIATVGATSAQVEKQLGKADNTTSDSAATYMYYEDSELCDYEGQMMYAFINDKLFGSQWYKQFDDVQTATKANDTFVKYFTDKFGKPSNTNEENGAVTTEWTIDKITFYVTMNSGQVVAYFIDYTAIYG